MSQIKKIEQFDKFIKTIETPFKSEHSIQE